MRKGKGYSLMAGKIDIVRARDWLSMKKTIPDL